MKRIFLVSSLCLLARMSFAVGGVDTPPPPGPPLEPSFAKPEEIRLSNGLRVIVASRPRLPLLAVDLLIRSGAEVDSAEHAGTADMTASLLTQGTDKMTAPQIATAIESLGGTIFSAGGWDHSSVGIAVMSNQAEPGLEILSDVVLHPAFREEELARSRKQALDGMRIDLQESGAVADYARVKVVFPAGEYSHPRTGTPETLPRITRADLLKTYETWFRPDNAVLVIVGDVTVEQAKGYAEKYFGGWTAKGDKPARPGVNESDPWKPRHVVIDLAEPGQAAVILALPALKRASPDYYAGVVCNAALGEGFASRLNQEIRIKRGLSYGAGSVIDARRDAGQFIARAQTKNESAAEVAGLLQAELKRLNAEPVQGDELKSRQAMLTGGYARSMETNFGVAGQIAALAEYDLPLEVLQTFVPSINGITSDHISQFAKKYFAEEPALIIAGRASAFAESLRKTFPDLQVISQSELDLNRADLTKAK